ncbi:MAG TPA: L,D-transpeptidase family protein, partial [Solirubrobacteraceae bacterium]|nr:L,D-transpeptidase family protein [Solirubrobacteraceae bacterium]
AARERVQSELDGEVAKPVKATYGDSTFTLTPETAQAGIDVDATVDAALREGRGSNPFSRVLGGNDGGGTVKPRVEFSRQAVDDFVERVAKDLDRDARDADIAWRDGKLERTRALAGLETQRDELAAMVLARMEDPAKERTIEVPVKETQRPDRTYEDLAKRYPTVIAVDRDAKRLRLYKHLQLEHKYRIAVGKAGHETKAGRYKIQTKQVDPPWHAPNSEWAGELAGQTIPPGDPRNPLEARWMGFHDGQGIHGTSDINSLGGSASHGCIRMAVDDVKELYDEVEKGTPVFVQ